MERNKFTQGQTTPFNVFGANKPKAPNLAPSQSTSPFSFRKKQSTSPMSSYTQNQSIQPNMSTIGGAVRSPEPQYIASSPSNTNTATPKLSPAGQQFAANQGQADPDIQRLFDAGMFNKADSGRDRDREADARFGVSDQKDSGKNKYVESIMAEQFPTKYKAEQDARDKAANRLATVQNMREKAELDARKAYEAELDRPGGTKAGAQQSAALVRRRSNGKLAMAKPCPYCQRVLSDAGVKGVFYTNQEGDIEYLKL